MTILITGGTGFVGSGLTDYLYNKGYSLILAVRNKEQRFPPDIQQVSIGHIFPDTDWTSALEKVDVVIHLAARVHIMHDTAADPLAEFRRTNTAGTLNLARQAATAGVRRFIYLSSIKVNGEHTQQGQPFTVSGEIKVPTDHYAISKYEAEQALRQLALETGMEVVIIRPPLVFGSGVKGNFKSMINWVNKGMPLPLGSIHNHRSLVSLPNLIDLITTCIEHPAAVNQTFLVSDGEDLSTTALLRRLGDALGKPARLLPVPQKLLETSLNLLGKQAIAQRLCGNLQIDLSHTLDTLGWKPPVSVEEALKITTQDWLAKNS